MTTRSVVLTQVPIVEAVTASCVLAGVAADVVPSEIGSIAVCHDPAVSYKAGVTISQLLKPSLVVLLQNEGDQVSAIGFADGKETEVQAAGLWLDAAPVVLEDLVTGAIEPSAVEGALTTVGMSRWRAARTLSKISRQLRARAARD